MGTQDFDPYELHDTLHKIAVALDAQLQPLAGLAEVLGRPQNVVNVPSDDWQCQTITFSDTTIRQIAGRDLTRLRVTVFNSGSAPAYLTPDNTSTVGAGALLGGKLPAGASITLATVGEISASFPAGAGELTVFFETRNPGGKPSAHDTIR